MSVENRVISPEEDECYMVSVFGFVQVNDSSSNDAEPKTTTPLSSPVKSSRSTITHASSAPASASVTGPDTRGTPSHMNSDSDEGDKNKKKV